MDTVIWIVVAIVVALLVLGLLAALMSKKKTEQRKAHATELRQDAQSRAPELDEADVRAREAEVEAERARLEAERAQTRATEAEQARAAEQAGYEDRIREADRVDPAVDTGASDYEPDTRYPADSDERAAAARGAGHRPHSPGRGRAQPRRHGDLPRRHRAPRGRLHRLTTALR